MIAPADRLPPDPAALTAFRRRVTGPQNACWPGPRKILVHRVHYTCRPLAWYAAHGVWPARQLRLTCATSNCLNDAHMTLIRGVEPTAWTKQGLPPDEVAHFLGIDEEALVRLCRRVLGKRTIGARDLDELAAAVLGQARLFEVS
jgi:hypothetical protein